MGAVPRILAVAGTAVYAHPSWLAAWPVLALTLGAGGLVATAALLVAVITHALAQTVAARAARLRIRRLTLYPFGGVVELDGDWRSPGLETLGALTGPLAALALAGFAAAARTAAAPSSPGLLYMVAAGVLVGLVNLLPAEPLDGGRLLRALAWWLTGRRAGHLPTASGRLVRLGVLVAGLLAVARGQALAGLWLIGLALLLRDAAQASAAEVALREALLPLKAREAMTRSVVAVPPDATIAQLAETFWTYHFTTYPVIADGTVLGIVDLRDVATVDRERWPRTRVRTVMHALTDDLGVTPGDNLLDALAKASRNGLGRVVVMDGRHLSGYLAMHDITAVLTRRGLGAAPVVSRTPPAAAVSRSPRP
jgi:CBS domain-containing protein/Zn-dependent protease